MPGVLKNRIERAVPDAAARTVALTWAGGAETVLDMGSTIARGGVFTALTDPAVFNAVSIGPRGRTLVWPGDLDLDADGIWFEAHPEDNPFTRPAAAE